MYLSNAIFALSAMVTLISSAPIPDAGNNRIQVSESQLIRFTELIVEGDNPEALLNFMKDATGSWSGSPGHRGRSVAGLIRGSPVWTGAAGHP